ncbi:unnamed protein product [Vicia faba]|uniref:Uncharacterized protein n=1 Tax=Vicia faba TaxID=3906 RepID=A0AAV0Z2L7_VICFA|nr:unnamed protein product [Vicia faba]
MKICSAVPEAVELHLSSNSFTHLLRLRLFFPFLASNSSNHAQRIDQPAKPRFASVFVASIKDEYEAFEKTKGSRFLQIRDVVFEVMNEDVVMMMTLAYSESRDEDGRLLTVMKQNDDDDDDDDCCRLLRALEGGR